MSKILSQDEIDALLSSAAALDGSRRDASGSPSTVVTYNFRRPDRISKEQIRSIHFLHDRFARNVSTSLSAYLRAVTEVSIVSVEQFCYSEFLMSLPDPTAFYALSLSPLDGLAALELNPAVAFTMVDRMLGGFGHNATLARALTEIEQNVVDSLVKIIIENLAETWKPVVDVQFRIHGRETRPQMLQVAGPNEIVVLLVFDIKVGETRGMLNFCVPASVIESSGSSFVQGWQRTRREPTATERTWLHESLGRVPMRVEGLLESQLRTRELIALGVGDVLTLGIPVGQPIDVRVGSTVKFRGRLQVQDGNAAIVVQEVLSRPVPTTPGVH